MLNDKVKISNMKTKKTVYVAIFAPHRTSRWLIITWIRKRLPIFLDVFSQHSSTLLFSACAPVQRWMWSDRQSGHTDHCVSEWATNGCHICSAQRRQQRVKNSHNSCRQMCGGKRWICRSRKWRTTSQGWNMKDLEILHKIFHNTA